MFGNLLSSSFLGWSEIPIISVECEKLWSAIYNFSGCDKNTPNFEWSWSAEVAWVEVPKSEVEEPRSSEFQRILRPSPKLTANPKLINPKIAWKQGSKLQLCSKLELSIFDTSIGNRHQGMTSESAKNSHVVESMTNSKVWSLFMDNPNMLQKSTSIKICEILIINIQLIL